MGNIVLESLGNQCSNQYNHIKNSMYLRSVTKKSLLLLANIVILIKVSPNFKFFSAFLQIGCIYIVSKGHPKIRKIEPL